MENIEPNQVTIPQRIVSILSKIKKHLNLPFKVTPAMGLMLSVLIILVLINVIVLIKRNSNPSPVSLIPSPVSSSTPNISAPPREISEFSKTQTFIDYEKRLFDLKSANDNVDLNENKLSFPVLDMDVNFEKSN